MPSHAVGSFRQRLDHQIFIIRSPSSHCSTRGRVDDVSNVVGDVSLLSAFIVQGDRTKCQRLEHSSDVDLGAASCANVEPS